MEERKENMDAAQEAAHGAEAHTEEGAAAARLGKFKSVDALLNAYNSLEAEFTRRSQRLRELEARAQNNGNAGSGDNAAPPAPRESSAPGTVPERAGGASLKTVPQSYREGAFGLGAGKWRVIRTVVLPGCTDGVITGCILAVGRILGESAALLFTAGLAHTLHGFFSGLGSSGATLTVALYVYAKERGEFEVAFAIAAILMLLTLIINLSADLVARYFRRKKEL